MCEICHRTPCAPGCPNEEVKYILCDECGARIPIGDYYVIDEDESGMLLCDNCADKLIDEYERRIEKLYERTIVTEKEVANA